MEVKYFLQNQNWIVRFAKIIHYWIFHSISSRGVICLIFSFLKFLNSNRPSVFGINCVSCHLLWDLVISKLISVFLQPNLYKWIELYHLSETIWGQHRFTQDYLDLNIWFCWMWYYFSIDKCILFLVKYCKNNIPCVSCSICIVTCLLVKLD